MTEGESLTTFTTGGRKSFERELPLRREPHHRRVDARRKGPGVLGHRRLNQSGVRLIFAYPSGALYGALFNHQAQPYP